MPAPLELPRSDVVTGLVALHELESKVWAAQNQGPLVGDGPRGRSGNPLGKSPIEIVVLVTRVEDGLEGSGIKHTRRVPIEGPDLCAADVGGANKVLLGLHEGHRVLHFLA